MSHSVVVPVPRVDARPPGAERRRKPRIRATRPAYVRLQGPARGFVVDLSQILDLSEEGLGIQTAGRIELHRPLQLALDLSQASANVPATGEIVWLDSQGRAGVRFQNLSDDARRVVQEWLALSIGQASSASPKKIPALAVVPVATATSPQGETVAPAPAPVIAPNVLAALESELNVIAQRAQAYTGASGAALALRQTEGMICCATCGTDTPGLGSRISTTSGITGECIRTARTMLCSDTRNDPRVNRAVCEELGIRSILAQPLMVTGQVVGLLEVFSPRPDLFAEGDGRALGILLAPVRQALSPENPATSPPSSPRPPQSAPLPAAPKPEPSVRTPLPGMRPVNDPAPVQRAATPLYQRLLLGAAVIAIAAVVGWLIRSESSVLLSLGQGAKPVDASAPAINVTAPRPSPAPTTLDALRSLAAQGDPAAQFAVGVKYATGDGVPRDDHQAAQWLSQAAENGHVGAQSALGACYWVGRGVPKDLKRAYFWSFLASASHDEISEVRVKALVRQLSSSDILEVEQQINEWFRVHNSQARR